MRIARLGQRVIEYDVERIKTLLGGAAGVAVYNSTDITITNSAVWTELTFDSERKDNFGFHSTVSNTSRLTVPDGYEGWYTITGHVTFDTSTSGTRRDVGIRLNGTTYVDISNVPVGNFPLRPLTAAVTYLEVGDYVELMVYQDTGGPLDILAQVAYSPEFRMVRTRW